MRSFLVVLLVVVAGVVCEKYTTKYDNVDLDEIIKSDRLLKNYVNCLLEKGNCTPDGTELKSEYRNNQNFWNIFISIVHLPNQHFFLRDFGTIELLLY